MTIVPLPPGQMSALAEEAKGFLNKLLGPACEEAGAMVGEHLRIFRLKRQIALCHKTKQILSANGLQPKAVNLNVLFPLVESAILEDDEKMTNRWASLLAYAADPNIEPTSEVVFIEILKQLPPVHAFILTVFYEQIRNREIPAERWSEEGIVASDFQEMVKPDDRRQLSASEFHIAIDNLHRLKLIDYPSVSLGRVNGNELRVQTLTANILCATHLGNAFFEACSKIPREGCSYGIPSDSISNIYAIDIWPTLPVTERFD